jgi:hypothetical protein
MRRGLRLAKLPPIVDHVIVAPTGLNYYYRSGFHYSAVDLIGCPKGKDCGIYKNDVANVWECVDHGEGNCFPVGDRRYNLTMHYIDEGIRTRYEGGADGHVIEFHWHCDPSKKPGEFDFWDIGEERFSMYSRTRTIIIHSHSVEVCLEADWGQVNGGAVFVFIVVGFLLLYFGFGTIVMFFLNGSVEIPNAGFWLEVYDSIATALLVIFTLGRETPQGPAYDRI